MRKTFKMRDVTPLVTAEELPAIVARDDYRYELVAGRVIRMSPPGWEHGVIVVRQSGCWMRTFGHAVSALWSQKSDSSFARIPIRSGVLTSHSCARTGCRLRKARLLVRRT